MPNSKTTYVTYNSGLDAKHLHLGNLVHSFDLPDSFEPYAEKTYTDITEPAPEWASSTALENFALTLGVGRDDSSSSDDEESGDDEAGQRYRVVAASKATKLEIKNSAKFFQQITLKSKPARKWLASRLSAAVLMAPHPPPEIWMLTGLVSMTHATWTSLSSKQRFVPGQQAPFDPTGVSAIRRSSVSEHVKPVFGADVKNDAHVPGAVIHETGKFPGTRGWACRWERVEFQVLPQAKYHGGDEQLALKGKPGGTPRIAEVKLVQGDFAEKSDDGEKYEDEDDEYWEKLLDTAEELSSEV